LKKRELELALAKERAERDQQEKEALEALKMRLESDKKKVESDLVAERALGLDKDTLLERSKHREAELEQEVADAQAELDTLDGQLDRAVKQRRELEEKHEVLKQAFDQAAEHLVRLESQQKEWGAHEGELVEQLNELQTEGDALRMERDELRKQCEELRNVVLQREEDIARAKERMEVAVADVTRKLTAETSQR
jgi:myosin protein heavy chain